MRTCGVTLPSGSSPCFECYDMYSIQEAQLYIDTQVMIEASEKIPPKRVSPVVFSFSES